MFHVKRIITHRKSFRYVLSISVLNMLGIGNLDSLSANNRSHYHNENDVFCDLASELSLHDEEEAICH